MMPIDAFNDAGLFGAMGFCGAYVLISIATPFYLKKIGELKARHIAMSVGALVLLIVPIVGTVYPVPPSPQNLFPYIFGAYILIGIAVVLGRSQSSADFDRIRAVLEETTATKVTPELDLPPDAHPAIA